MYIDFLVNDPSLSELFADYIGYSLYADSLVANPPQAENPLMLQKVTFGLQRATQDLQDAIEQSYPPSFTQYIPMAAERIMQRKPGGEGYYLSRIEELCQ